MFAAGAVHGIGRRLFRQLLPADRARLSHYVRHNSPSVTRLRIVHVRFHSSAPLRASRSQQWLHEKVIELHAGAELLDCGRV